MQRNRTLNDLIVATNRTQVIIDAINPLAGPIKQSCTAVHDIIRKISLSY